LIFANTTPCGFDLTLAQYFIANDSCACEYNKICTTKINKNSVGGGAKIPPTLFFFKGQNSIEVPYKKLGTSKTKTYILKERPKIKMKVPMRGGMNAREEPRGRKGDGF
jgi:hypothetical protein